MLNLWDGDGGREGEREREREQRYNGGDSGDTAG